MMGLTDLLLLLVTVVSLTVIIAGALAYGIVYSVNVLLDSDDDWCITNDDKY